MKGSSVSVSVFVDGRFSVLAWMYGRIAFSSNEKLSPSVRSPFSVFVSQINVLIRAVISGWLNDPFFLNISSLLREM